LAIVALSAPLNANERGSLTTMLRGRRAHHQVGQPAVPESDLRRRTRRCRCRERRELQS